MGEFFPRQKFIFGVGCADTIVPSWLNNATIYFLDDISSVVWIVIAMEGSLSINDCLTNATADSVHFAEVGKESRFDGSGGYAYTVFFNAAVEKSLMNARVLAFLTHESKMM